jgi:hypothetical protein
MIPVSPRPTDQSPIQGELVVRPCSRRRGQVEPSTLKSQVQSANPPQTQLSAILLEPPSTTPLFAQITESKPFDRKRPYKQPVKDQMSEMVDGFGNDIQATYDRPFKLSGSHGQPAHTRLLFDKPVNTDTISENVEERGGYKPKDKLPESTGPKDFNEASTYPLTGAPERLATFPQFVRDLSADAERHEAPEFEKVLSHVAPTV